MLHTKRSDIIRGATKSRTPNVLKKLVFLLAVILFASCTKQKEPVDYVDPLIGTSSSRWMLFPGAAMPFGMVKLSPDNTNETQYKLGAGYEYKINSITGFGHMHSWMIGSFVTMPTTGELKVKPGTVEDPDSGYRSRIDNRNVEASPGYYSNILLDYNIKAELTATTRCGFQRYTFPKTGNGRVLFDLQGTEEETPVILEAMIKKVSDTEIEGYVKRVAGVWNEYTLYFFARFNRPFKSMGAWTGDMIIQNTDEVKITKDMDIGAFVNFDLNDDRVVLLQTGISYVGLDQAKLNLDTEMKPFGWDFDKAHLHARNVWNKLLSRIKVEGGTEQDKVKFYTNLYRSFVSRSIYSDVNGKYVDMCEKVKQTDPDSPIYGCDAFWGSQWNINILWSLLIPEETNQWVKSLLKLYEDGGWLPDAPGGLEYSHIMVGAAQVPFVVNAYQKGIRNFDAEEAYEAMRKNQMEPGQPHECGGYVGNRNLKTYMQIGYVPAGEGPVSNTLEYAYDDWTVAQMAKALGKTEDYKYFMDRSQYYRNVFDPKAKYVRPKFKGGPWSDEFTTTKGAGGTGQEFGYGSKDYVEGNAWQYTWFVPHDMKGLVELMGKEEFVKRLNDGFEKSRPYFTTEYVNIGNQPNMEAPWLFNYAGAPWLTQYWLREVLEGYFGTTPENGYHGDEDQGQMGSFYVMSAMGLFQMDGGTSVNPVYEIAGPVFSKITIKLDPKYYKGGEFVIEAKNASLKNRYVQSATLNGKPLNKFWFRHSELVSGGRLVLEMGPEPNKEWAADSPFPQVNDVPPIVPTPYVIDTKRNFRGNETVKMACGTEGAKIFFTTDGSEPDKNSKSYTEPFEIRKTVTLKMKAFKDGRWSLTNTAVLEKAKPVEHVSMNQVKPRLRYKYTEGIYRMVHDILDKKPKKTGLVPTFTIEPKETEQFFSFEFSGYLNVPADGEYTFYLACNDGGQFFIDNMMLINNDGLHPVVEVAKSIKLTKGLHPVSVRYFQEGGRNGLKVSWKGPGIEKQEIPAGVLFHKK